MRHLIETLTEAVKKHTGVFFHLRVDGKQLEVFSAAQKAVTELLGPLEEGDHPHVTVLYMGKDVPKLSEVADKAGKLLGEPISLYPDGVHWFEPTGNSEGRTPILISYRSAGLSKLNGALLRGLASHVTQDQFPDFKAHATLGYLPRKLTSSEKKSLKAMEVSPRAWEPSKVYLQKGERRLRTYTLGG